MVSRFSEDIQNNMTPGLVSVGYEFGVFETAWALVAGASSPEPGCEGNSRPELPQPKIAFNNKEA